MNLSTSEDPSSTPRGPGVEHSETTLAFEVTIKALPSSIFILLCPTAPFPLSAPRFSGFPAPQGSALASPTPSRLWGPGSQTFLEPGQTPEPQELTAATSAQTVHCQSRFLGPARVPGARAEPGRGEVYFSADEHLPVARLSQDKSPASFSLALSPLYKNNFISKEQITPSAHNRCQELFLF